MREIDQDHAIVMIHVIDINDDDDDVHHLMVEDQEEIEVVVVTVVENVIVLGHHPIINQVQNDFVSLRKMINIVLHIHIKMEIVKNIDHHTVQYNNLFNSPMINRHVPSILLVLLCFTFLLILNLFMHVRSFFSISFH